MPVTRSVRGSSTSHRIAMLSSGNQVLLLTLALGAWIAIAVPLPSAADQSVPVDDVFPEWFPRPPDAPSGPEPAAAIGPSFNCGLARLPAEVAICNSPGLSDLDRTMAELYFSRRNSLAGSMRRDLQAFQKQWLRRRNACGYDPACLERRHFEQIEGLQRWPSR